jgi:hypothetical protein
LEFALGNSGYLSQRAGREEKRRARRREEKEEEKRPIGRSAFPGLTQEHDLLWGKARMAVPLGLVLAQWMTSLEKG